jgi:hypothetical protein
VGCCAVRRGLCGWGAGPGLVCVGQAVAGGGASCWLRAGGGRAVVRRRGRPQDHSSTPGTPGDPKPPDPHPARPMARPSPHPSPMWHAPTPRHQMNGRAALATGLAFGCPLSVAPPPAPRRTEASSLRTMLRTCACALGTSTCSFIERPQTPRQPLGSRRVPNRTATRYTCDVRNEH